MAKTMTLNLTDEEMAAVDQLADEADMSKTAVLRQALRLYQLVVLRAKDGETLHFSGDPQRALQFIGPGFPFVGGDKQ
jgi:Ribbon-helix-helix protein, copG family